MPSGRAGSPSRPVVGARGISSKKKSDRKSRRGKRY